MTLYDIKYWFKDNQFEIYVFVAVCTLLIFSIYNFINKKNGTWCVPSFIPFNLKQFITSDQNSCESKGESVVRQYLNNRFNVIFDKVRNLYNPITGQFLEIDCYNDILKLGVEYQGKQHYVYTPFFHKNKEAFRNQQYRDELKRIYCRDAGIHLIEVPYTVKAHDIPYYLESKLMDYGY